MREAVGRFVGKIGIVSGAAKGIGKAVALRMAREGGTVVLVDRSELVREVTEQIENDGGQAVAVIADLERYAGATMTVDVARQRFGKIDILLNNVGGTIWAMPYNEYAEHQNDTEIWRSAFLTH